MKRYLSLFILLLTCLLNVYPLSAMDKTREPNAQKPSFDEQLARLLQEQEYMKQEQAHLRQQNVQMMQHLNSQNGQNQRSAPAAQHIHYAQPASYAAQAPQQQQVPPPPSMPYLPTLPSYVPALAASSSSAAQTPVSQPQFPPFPAPMPSLHFPIHGAASSSSAYTQSQPMNIVQPASFPSVVVMPPGPMLAQPAGVQFQVPPVAGMQPYTIIPHTGPAPMLAQSTQRAQPAPLMNAAAPRVSAPKIAVMPTQNRPLPTLARQMHPPASSSQQPVSAAPLQRPPLKAGQQGQAAQSPAQSPAHSAAQSPAHAALASRASEESTRLLKTVGGILLPVEGPLMEYQSVADFIQQQQNLYQMNEIEKLQSEESARYLSARYLRTVGGILLPVEGPLMEHQSVADFIQQQQNHYQCGVKEKLNKEYLWKYHDTLLYGLIYNAESRFNCLNERSYTWKCNPDKVKPLMDVRALIYCKTREAIEREQIATGNEARLMPIYKRLTSPHLREDVFKSLTTAAGKQEIVRPHGQDQMNMVHLMAEKGDFEAMKKFINAGIDCTISNRYGYCPLRIAALNGHRRIVELLLPKTNAGKSFLNAFDSALYAKNEDIAGLILAHWDKIKSAKYNEYDYTFLKSALKRGSQRFAALLFERGVQHPDILLWAIESNDKNSVQLALTNNYSMASVSALLHALSLGNREIIAFIFSHLRDQLAPDTQNASELLLKAADGGNSDLIAALLECGVKEIHGESKTLALHNAAASGSVACLKVLCDKAGKDNFDSYVNSLDDVGKSPLWHAIANGHREVMNYLLSLNASVIDRLGSTPLMIAADYGHAELLKDLIARGHDVNAKNTNGETALWFAALKGHVDCMQLLLDARADANCKNNEGCTALHIATLNAKFPAVQLLLNSSVDIYQKYKGKTALSIAMGKNDYQLINALLPTPLTPENLQKLITVDDNYLILSNYKNKDGKWCMFQNFTDAQQVTPLFFALNLRHRLFIQALLAMGARVDKPVYTSKNCIRYPIHYAVNRADNHETLRLFLDTYEQVQWADASAKNYHDLIGFDWARPEYYALLAQAGLNVNAKHPESGQTCLMRRCQEGKLDAVKALLAMPGIDINRAEKRSTALYLAANEKHWHIFKALIEAGALYSYSFAFSAIKNAVPPLKPVLFHEINALLKKEGNLDSDLLINLIKESNYSLLKDAIHSTERANAISSTDLPALHAAVHIALTVYNNDHPAHNVVPLLLEKGAVRERLFQGLSALVCALGHIFNNQLSLTPPLHKLINALVPENLTGNDLITQGFVLNDLHCSNCFHLAFLAKNVPLLRAIKQLGHAEADFIFFARQFISTMTEGEADAPIIRFIIESKLDLVLEYILGQINDISKERIAFMIRSCGLDPNTRIPNDIDKKTLLMKFALDQRADIVETLIKLGADPLLVTEGQNFGNTITDLLRHRKGAPAMRKVIETAHQEYKEQEVQRNASKRKQTEEQNAKRARGEKEIMDAEVVPLQDQQHSSSTSATAAAVASASSYAVAASSASAAPLNPIADPNSNAASLAALAASAAAVSASSLSAALDAQGETMPVRTTRTLVPRVASTAAARAISHMAASSSSEAMAASAATQSNHQIITIEDDATLDEDDDVEVTVVNGGQVSSMQS